MDYKVVGAFLPGPGDDELDKGDIIPKSMEDLYIYKHYKSPDC